MLTVYIPLKPGQDPSTVTGDVDIQKLHFKFAEMSDQELIDLAAGVGKSLNAMEKWHKSAVDILKGRLVVPQAVGEVTTTQAEKYIAHYSKEARVDIDRESVKKDMGDDWYAAHCKRLEYVKLSFKPID